jgi:hypothetical protein
LIPTPVIGAERTSIAAQIATTIAKTVVRSISVASENCSFIVTV